MNALRRIDISNLTKSGECSWLGIFSHRWWKNYAYGKGLAFTAMHFRIRAIARRQVVNHATLPTTEKRQIIICI